MASPPRARCALRVRVEEARGLLPLAEAPESDAPLLVTLRLAPGETTHSARTRAVRRGLEPAWHEEILVRPLPPEARFVEFKVRREAEGLFSGRAFLGRATVRIPRRGAPAEVGWFELRAGEGGKHAEELAARCRRAGRPGGELGELKVSVERLELAGGAADAEAAERDSPRTPEAEPPRRRRAAATPPTPWDEHAAETEEKDNSKDKEERHGLLAALRHVITGGGEAEAEPRAERSEASTSSAARRSAAHATHVHVAVVAARGLLPSDFPAAGEEGEGGAPGQGGGGPSGPSSDPYAAVRLLPALPEERHVTRVLPRTLDPLWEEELIFRRVHGSYGVEIKVWDYDSLTRDDYLGEVLLPLPDEAAGAAGADAAAAVAASAADAAEAATEAEEEDVSPPQGERPAVAASTAAGGPTPRAALAATPPPPPKGSPPLGRTRPGVLEGWFPLEASPRYEDDVAAALRRAGRAKGDQREGSPIPQGALGEIYVRISYGDGRPRPHAARAAALLRPAAHRAPVASLRVRIQAARGLPPPPRDAADAAGEGIAVSVRCERQRGATPAMPPPGDGGEVTWRADEATFTFQVTEITSDAVMALQIRRNGALVATLGEVPLPLPLLLAPDAARAAAALRGGAALRCVAGPAWASVLAPRAPGEVLFRSAAAAGGAQIRWEAELTLNNASAARAYTASEPLQPQPRAGPADAAARDELLPGPHPAAAAARAAARLADAVLAIIAAPLRTALYLQSWQEPALNVALVIALAAAAHRRTSAAAAACWPLWLVAFLLLNGYASHRIHAADAPPGERSTASEAAAATSDSDASDDADDATSSDAGRYMRAPGGTLPPLDARERDAAAAHYASHRASLARFAFSADAAAAWLERCCGALTWHDPALSALAACALLAGGASASLLLAALRTARLFSASGLVLLAGLYALVPMFAPLSRAALDAADLHLSEASPVRLRSLCAGSGLRPTALPDSPPPGASPAARRGAAKARRDAAARRDEHRGRAATHGGEPQQQPPPGSLRHMLRAAAPRLLARAADERRATHLRIARLATMLATPPEDDLSSAVTQ